MLKSDEILDFLLLVNLTSQLEYSLSIEYYVIILTDANWETYLQISHFFEFYLVVVYS